jgi:hypothetical protein
MSIYRSLSAICLQVKCSFSILLPAFVLYKLDGTDEQIRYVLSGRLLGTFDLEFLTRNCTISEEDIKLVQAIVSGSNDYLPARFQFAKLADIFLRGHNCIMRAWCHTQVNCSGSSDTVF